MADVKTRRSAVLRLVAFGAILLGGLALARFTPLGDYLTRDGIGAAIAALRGSTWAPIVFIAVYAGATALAIPGTILTLAGGALFGLYWGTVFNSIAANIGANLAFLVARVLGREGIQGLLGADSPALAKLDAVVREHGFRGLLTLRLIPLVPFNALNFGSGLLSISWGRYALATLIGIFPGTVVYTFFADALLQGSQEASREALIRVLIAGSLLILLSFLPTIMKRLNVKLPGAVTLLLLGTALTGPVHAQVPDHQAFTQVLDKIVVEQGIDYATLEEDRDGLDGYLGQLARTDPAALERAPGPVQLAFWINAYNACMLRQVVDHYPIERHPGLLGALKNRIANRPANSVWQIPDVFERSFCEVAGSTRSQDEIEHEIIRPMGDPRIHFAVNCAARSCPPLRHEAYVPEHLDDQLDDAVRKLVANAEHFRIEREGGTTLRLNKVLDWYKDDFGGTEGLKAFLATYVTGRERAALEDPSTAVEYFDYDWTLNDISR